MTNVTECVPKIWHMMPKNAAQVVNSQVFETVLDQGLILVWGLSNVQINY